MFGPSNFDVIASKLACTSMQTYDRVKIESLDNSLGKIETLCVNGCFDNRIQKIVLPIQIRYLKLLVCLGVLFWIEVKKDQLRKPSRPFPEFLPLMPHRFLASPNR